jgi:hypothetical protein
MDGRARKTGHLKKENFAMGRMTICMLHARFFSPPHNSMVGASALWAPYWGQAWGPSDGLHTWGNSGDRMVTCQIPKFLAEARFQTVLIGVYC